MIWVHNIKEVNPRPNALLEVWLGDVGSTTLKLNALGYAMRIDVLAEGAETWPLSWTKRQYNAVWQREVEIFVNDSLWIRACSFFPEHFFLRYGKLIQDLGLQSLGAVLANAGIEMQRQQVCYAYDKDLQLYCRESQIGCADLGFHIVEAFMEMHPIFRAAAVASS